MKPLVLFVISSLVVFVPLIKAQEEWPICDPAKVTWHPHPYTCTRYVLCFHGNPVERLCSRGLHFNRFDEQCQPPQLARCDINYACPAVDDELNPVFLPNESDCSKYFVCFKGSPIARECHQGLWWDVVYNWCTFYDEVTCDSKAPNNPNTTPAPTLPPVGTSPPTEPPTMAPTLPPAPTDPPAVPTTTLTPTTTPDPNTYECPLSSDPTFHPHSRECESFFICINGVAFLRQCANGTVFDIVERKCREPDLATCISGAVISPGDHLPGSGSYPFSCPLGDYEVLFYPHQSKCHRYYECRKGIAYLRNCPTDQQYDFESEACEDRLKAFCFNDLHA